MAPVWLAADSGAFAELNLDTEVSFIGAGQAILGALSSQEAPLVMAGASQAIEASLQGGDYIVLGSAVPYLTNSIFVTPSIERPEDLRGKSVGVSNFGAISHIALKIALEHWKMEEGRDVAAVRTGGTPETVAAMQTGAVAGGSFSPPATFRARDLGYRELLDLATTRYEFGSAAIVSTRGYVAANPDVVERYLKALIRGTHVYKTNREAGVASIMKYTQLDDRQVAEETWAYFRDKLNDDLTASVRGMENNLRLLGETHPAALTARPEQFLDTSFVDRIKASGYLEQVRRGQ
jgi:NitT/TauT family transport system substrate-binding protein